MRFNKILVIISVHNKVNIFLMNNGTDGIVM